MITPLRLTPILFVLLCASACTRPTVLLANPPPIAFIQAEQAAVRQAILGAMYDKGWVVAEEGTGRLIARLHRRKHSVLIEIDYRRDVVISYVDSTQMKYEKKSGAEYIHPQYNRWTRMLARRIDDRIRSLPPAPATAGGEAATVPAVQPAPTVAQ